MNNIPGLGQLPAWAVARSLAAMSNEIHLHQPKFFKLSARLLTNSRISLTAGDEIVFENKNLLHAAKKGFAFPEILPLCKHPFVSFKGIRTLMEIKGLYNRSPSKQDVKIFFQGGIEATTCYLNHHPPAQDLMGDEKGIIDCYLDKSFFLGRIFLSNDDAWECTSRKPDTEPSVVLNFKNLNSAIRGACGQIDPLADPALGNINVSGRIPLLDKFGFVARIASREVPSPLQKFHAK